MAHEQTVQVDEEKLDWMPPSLCELEAELETLEGVYDDSDSSDSDEDDNYEWRPNDPDEMVEKYITLRNSGDMVDFPEVAEAIFKWSRKGGRNKVWTTEDALAASKLRAALEGVEFTEDGVKGPTKLVEEYYLRHDIICDPSNKDCTNTTPGIVRSVKKKLLLAQKVHWMGGVYINNGTYATYLSLLPSRAEVQACYCLDKFGRMSRAINGPLLAMRQISLMSFSAESETTSHLKIKLKAA